MSKNIVVSSIAAYCVGHRGIGKNGKLPWPFLKEDYEFYTSLCKNTKDPKKKNGIIMGRHGWSTWQEDNKTNPKMVTVVTSNSLPKDEPHCFGVAQSFDEAINMFLNSPIIDEIESIYNLGGVKNYEDALTHPLCNQLILTRLYQDYDSDVFFPQFEHLFTRVSHPEIPDDIREDPATGTKFRFEVWVKNS